MFSTHQAILLIVDIQGKLSEIVHQSERMIENTQRLIQACKFLDVPVLLTEQMPSKIGPTIVPITRYLKNIEPIAKKSFSCCGDSMFLEALHKSKRHQVIICGIEAHVCIYQTVMHLLEQSLQVQVVEDAVSSRTLTNKQIALARMDKAGAFITSTEMIITELLQTAEHPKFKKVLSLIK